jgi:hypothetical protein
LSYPVDGYFLSFIETFLVGVSIHKMLPDGGIVRDVEAGVGA